MHVQIGVRGTALVTAALAALGGLAGCGGGGDAAKPAKQSDQAGQAGQAQPIEPGVPAVPAQPGTPATAPKSVTVKVTTTSLGSVLTDQDGRTLYGFTADKGGVSSCADDCINAWPALVSQTPVKAGPGTKASLFGTTERTEGTVQATYGKWPLYYYAGDVNPGDIDGQGVERVWFVVGADGKLIRTEPKS
jgi:predicted lipoprotein with Yx(FWY)xxD motif